MQHTPAPPGATTSSAPLESDPEPRLSRLAPSRGGSSRLASPRLSNLAVRGLRELSVPRSADRDSFAATPTCQ
jgi:hypothetical protein